MMNLYKVFNLQNSCLKKILMMNSHVQKCNYLLYGHLQTSKNSYKSIVKLYMNKSNSSFGKLKVMLLSVKYNVDFGRESIKNNLKSLFLVDNLLLKSTNNLIWTNS